MRNNGNLHRGQTGFTLVELVMVIILIGILSAGAASLFFSRDAYAPFTAKDQFISQALLAQQVAMGMSATNNPVSLTIAVDGSEWVFTLAKVGEDTREFRQENGSASLIIEGTVVADGGSQTFTWDSRANLADNTNYDIQFVGESSYRVCLSASGFPYESVGACP